MAKRFYNTQRIEEDWYINLSCKHRELLRYCESKCDGAGIFSWNAKIATTYIGEKVTDLDLKHIPVSKLPNGKFFIRGFCFFQNGILSKKSPAHNPIFKSLEENKITEETLSNTLSDTLHGSVLEGEEEKELVKEKEKVEEVESVSEVLQEKTPLSKAFDEWIEMRKKMKGGITDRAIELGKSELKKLSGGSQETAIAIINQSILNSWKGFFPLHNQNNGKQIRKGQPDTQDAVNWANRVLSGEDDTRGDTMQ